MSYRIYNWEKPLLAMAYDGRHVTLPAELTAVYDPGLLAQAYAHCEASENERHPGDK